jgi:hypothetical protein
MLARSLLFRTTARYYRLQPRLKIVSLWSTQPALLLVQTLDEVFGAVQSCLCAYAGTASSPRTEITYQNNRLLWLVESPVIGQAFRPGLIWAA